VSSDAALPTATATAEARSSSRIYDLTHEILYLHHVKPGTAADPVLAAHLADLLGEVMASNSDLGAEILACYWMAGGSASPASRAPAGQLKAFSEEQPAECEPGRDGECNCPRFKEQIHSRLTTVLGLGTTLATAGEVLDHDGETPAQTP
jgi:hypothetical protein